MAGIINFIFSYLFILFVWSVFNLIFYALTVVLKKSFFYVPLFINTFLNWGIKIYIIGYALYYLWQLIVAHAWILLVLALIFGLYIISWWQIVYGFLIYPIGMITAFFSEKALIKVEQNENEYDYEVISPKGEVIGKYSSDDKATKYLARWFVAGYIMIFIYQFINHATYGGYGWYIINPFIWFCIFSLPFAIVIGIWNLIKTRSFFNGDKKKFVGKAFKIFDLIYGCLLGLELINMLS